ncbi:MAG: lipoyl(octanoyl) transferase LipB [Planctomycetes bacterium]|nr:lipoyl(octanoyl) transferase LipB [Planctomycetota bacterium]
MPDPAPHTTPRNKPAIDLVVRDLGRMSYAEAHVLQKELQREVIESREDQSGDSRTMYLLLVEHDPPVITISRRKGARKNLMASDAQLAAAGVEICETDRGGDITYHGPGQLVAYPILDLNVLGLRVHSYMRFLEQIVIDTLGKFGIEGHRDPEATGVWVIPNSKAQGSPSLGFEDSSYAKICALGVRISRWVSMHGLALNVDPDLSHYDLIVPCGLPGRKVTSLLKELGDDAPSLEEAKVALTSAFRTKLNS